MLKVLLDGLYDRGSSLNMLKRDKDGIARDYSPILENIWEFTTKWPHWEVLNKACVILIIVNVGLAELDASTDINDSIINMNLTIVTMKIIVRLKMFEQVYTEEPADSEDS